MKSFSVQELQGLKKKSFGTKGTNGQVIVIGGSQLFHGAPILSLIAASRVVDMVFFASPEKPLEKVTAQIKSKLASFIWVPWNNVDEYITKSDALLIGPGFMRDTSLTKKVTLDLFQKFPDKKWVVDGGSLQVIAASYLPKESIITPNQKEYSILFDIKSVTDMAKKYQIIIAAKNPHEMIISDSTNSYTIPLGKVPLSGGGIGDVLAGLTVGLLAGNPPLLSAAAAGFLVQQTAQSLYHQNGNYFNADDLAWEIGKVWKKSV